MVFPILGSGDSSSGYDIENSLRFDDITAHFQRTPGSAGNRQIFTISMWLKICSAGKDTAGHHIFYVNNPSDTTTWGGLYLNTDKLHFYAEASGSGHYSLIPNRLFRDPSAWYHIVIAVDTTDGTAADRIKFYVNGVQETSFGTANYPSQNDNTVFNNSGPHALGAYNPGTNYPPGAGLNMFDGHLAEVYMIDGTQLAPTSFGEFDNDSGIWKPIEYAGSYGTNGFFLEFKQTGTSADASGKGADTSGEDNHWDDNGMSVFDQTTDTPTNNFCTLNPIAVPDNLSDYTSRIVEGACELSSSTVADSFEYMGTMPTNMKYYFECKLSTVYDNNGDQRVGIVSVDKSSGSTSQTGAGAGAVYGGTGSISSVNRAGGSVATTLTGKTTFADGQIIGVAVDNTTNNDVKFYNNGVLQGTIDIVSTELYMPYFRCMGAGGQTNVWQTNFGNPPFTLSSPQSDANGYGNFEYEPPSGYYALCTKNLAEYG